MSLYMWLLATFIETRLVRSDLLAKVHIQQSITSYMQMISVSVFFRDSCFFAWFLVFRLYTLQKDAFRAKQRASVLEHQSVQFSTPDQKEISIPIDLIIYIQEVDHTTQIYCTENRTVTVSEPLSNLIHHPHRRRILQRGVRMPDARAVVFDGRHAKISEKSTSG